MSKLAVGLVVLGALAAAAIGGTLIYLFIFKKKDAGTAKQEEKKKKWLIRYLRLQRMDGRDDFVHVESMELWNNGKRIYARSGETSPFYSLNLTDQAMDWTKANDDNPIRHKEAKGTIAHTDPTKDAYIELDFGEDQEADTIRLVHRQSFQPWNKDRIKGTRFTARNSKGDVVLSHDIKDARFTILTFTYPDGVKGSTDWTAADLKTMLDQNAMWE